MRPSPTPALLAGLLGCVLVLAACTGDDEPARDAGPPDLPVLEAAWTSSAVPEAGRGSTAVQTWTFEDTLVVTSERRVAALDPATGETRWALETPGLPCAWADGPNQAGLLVVALERTAVKPSRCLDVAAIDLTTGEVAWKQRLTHPVDYHRAEYDGVGAGEEVVGVVDSTFNAVARLDARTGRVLSVAERDLNQVTVGEGRLAGIRYADFPRATARVVVEDLDTGDRVAAYPAGDVYSARVVHTEPLVVAATRGQWGSELRVGVDGVIVGRGPGLSTQVVDGLVIADPVAGVFAHDLTTGEEVAAVPHDAFQTLVGIHAGDAILTNRAPYWRASSETVALRTSLDESGEQQVLGTVEGSAVALVEDTLVTSGGGTLTAYRLPTAGTDVTAFVDALPWASGDLRPDEAFDACAAISDDTLTTLGLAADERVVGSCEWGGGEHLVVSVDAVPPRGDRSATELATDRLYVSGESEEIPGLGDDAYVDADDFGATVEARRGNVVVRVRTTVDDTTPARSRAAAVQAAREVIAELDTRLEES